MNCRLCGYYYNKREQGDTCGHCGGNRNGLSVTRLMRASKLIAAAAILLPLIVAVIDWDTVVFTVEKLLRIPEPEELEGRSGAWDFGGLFLMQTVCAWLFAAWGIIRKKRCSFLPYTAAAMITFPMAVYGFFDNEPMLMFGCTMPFFLYIAAGLTALTDKKNQINEHRMKYPLKKEV